MTESGGSWIVVLYIIFFWQIPVLYVLNVQRVHVLPEIIRRPGTVHVYRILDVNCSSFSCPGSIWGLSYCTESVGRGGGAIGGYLGSAMRCCGSLGCAIQVGLLPAAARDRG